MNDQYTQKPMGAIILAGGKSKRMEEDKSLLMVSGFRLIEKIARDISPFFAEIIISSNQEAVNRYSFLPYRKVVDEIQDQGPLQGISNGLQAASFPLNFVIACDIPEINISFLHKMMLYTDDYDIVVPVTNGNKMEPLFAFYHNRLVPLIEGLLQRGIKKVIELFPLCRVKYLPLEGDWYYNLNTSEDYQSYLNARGAGSPSVEPLR
ncbi:MAG: molybdenum cofactor guanylyltransferase [Acidobacteria bacterium]|jgi:molybdopterin-guanine dinucleotide biosynthesis protein A|nr:molybdenum cofactor guanylyltransferase [Acidobacteriota bacterium]